MDISDLALRPYQIEAYERSWERIDDRKDPIVSLFTGAGKGFTMAFLGKKAAETSGKRVLYLCHRAELANQIESNLRIVDPGQGIGVERGESRADTRGIKPRYVVAMVQSIGRKSASNRLKVFRPEDFCLVITDEAHHCHISGTSISTKNGTVSVENVRVGDEVVSWSGEHFVAKKVTRLYSYYHDAPIVKLTTESGRSVSVTTNHKMLGSSGMVRADRFRPGDYLYAEGIHQGIACKGNGGAFCESGVSSQAVCQDEGEKPSQQTGREEEDFCFHQETDRFGRGGPFRKQSHAWKRERSHEVGGVACGDVPTGSGELLGRNRGWRATAPLQDRRGFRQEDGRCGTGRVFTCEQERSRRQEGSPPVKEGMDDSSVCERDVIIGDRIVSCEIRHYTGMIYDFEVDEFHNYVANGLVSSNSTAPIYKSIRDHFTGNKNCRFAGFSATWINGAGEGIGVAAGYNCVAYRMSMLDGVRQGWLVKPKCWPMHVTSIDWGSVKANNEGILDEAEVERAMLEEKPFHELAMAVLDRTVRRRALIYGPGKDWAKATYQAFRRYVADDVRLVTDDTPEHERGTAVSDFRSAVYSKLINVQILTEGTDIPIADCAVLCRPCQSEVLLTQIVGRVLRPETGLLDHPDRRGILWHDVDARIAAIAGSNKPDALVLDMAARGVRKIVTTADILGSEYPAAVVDYAKKIAGDDQTDPVETLDRAKVEWALIQEEISRRSKVKAVGVSYETHEVDLFDPRQAAAPMPSASQAEPSTAAQQGFIVDRMGWTKAKAMSLSKKAASAIIAKFNKGELKPKNINTETPTY